MASQAADDPRFAENLDRCRRIEFEQPAFWWRLQQFGQELKASEGYYWDDHSVGRVDGPVDYLIVAQRLNPHTGALVLPGVSDKDDYNTRAYPLAWISPFAGTRSPDFPLEQYLNNLYLPAEDVLAKRRADSPPGYRCPRITMTDCACGGRMTHDEFARLLRGALIERRQPYATPDSKLPHPTQRHYALPIQSFLRLVQ